MCLKGVMLVLDLPAELQAPACLYGVEEA